MLELGSRLTRWFVSFAELSCMLIVNSNLHVDSYFFSS